VKFPAAVSLATAVSISAALAGCATSEPKSFSGLDRPAKPVVTQMPYKAGSGIVQSWAAAPSPAAGASGRVDPSAGTLRMAIKMDDGSVQYVDTDSRDFPVGTRVQLTGDHIIQRP
jgi:outer membrane lipoprotein SlyB